MCLLLPCRAAMMGSLRATEWVCFLKAFLHRIVSVAPLEFLTTYSIFSMDSSVGSLCDPTFVSTYIIGQLAEISTILVRPSC